MQNVVACVLGGGRGTRLFPLTQMRSKPAVPLAGKYRLIDIPLSNCINSEINRIYLLTQFMSVSLHRHIRQTYIFDRFNDGFVEILAAQQTDEGKDWYQGTADAVRKNLRYLDQPGADLVLILSGDQLYRMDYREMVNTHIQQAADATIAVLPVTRNEARQFGVMRLDESERVIDFVEKPQSDEQISSVALNPQDVAKYGNSSGGRDCLASMGIYLFNRETLRELLDTSNYEDFGREVFPQAMKTKRVFAHRYDGYWRDIGTIRSFFDANLAMAQTNAPFNLYVGDAPIYSRARFLPPSRIGDSKVNGSLMADGCRVGNGCTIENSVIGHRCVIRDNVTIKNSILMGSDVYETDLDQVRNSTSGRPDIGIGEGSRIVGSIVDKNCRIGAGVVIENSQEVMEKSWPNLCYIRDGIMVVPKDTTVPNRWNGQGGD